MSSKPKTWPPKGIVRALQVLYLLDQKKGMGTHSDIQQEVGCAYTTVHRYLRVLREVFSVKIEARQEVFSRFKRPSYYLIKDWGIIKERSFRENFPTQIKPSVDELDRQEGRNQSSGEK